MIVQHTPSNDPERLLLAISSGVDPPPVYCARTLGPPDYYAEPIEAGREAAIR